MSTYVQRAVTEVVPEPEPVAATGEKPGEGRWEKEDRLRQQLEQQRRLALRTRAEGFDD
jgi:hypothetical protein